MAADGEGSQGGLYCSTAGAYFESKDELAEHYRSDFHRRASTATHALHGCASRVSVRSPAALRRCGTPAGDVCCARCSSGSQHVANFAPPPTQPPSRYNLKRKIAGLPPVTREWYEARRAQLLASSATPVQKVRGAGAAWRS